MKIVLKTSKKFVHLLPEYTKGIRDSWDLGGAKIDLLFSGIPDEKLIDTSIFNVVRTPFNEGSAEEVVPSIREYLKNVEEQYVIILVADVIPVPAEFTTTIENGFPSTEPCDKQIIPQLNAIAEIMSCRNIKVCDVTTQRHGQELVDLPEDLFKYGYFEGCVLSVNFLKEALNSTPIRAMETLEYFEDYLHFVLKPAYYCVNKPIMSFNQSHNNIGPTDG